MNVSEQTKSVLAEFGAKKHAFAEYTLASAIQRSNDGTQNQSQGERDAWWAELAAFKLNCLLDGQSEWGTSFGPWMTATRADGTTQHFPEAGEIDEPVIEHWRQRAEEEKNPILKARYSDLVWDQTKRVTGGKRDARFAEMAVTSYIAAANLVDSSDLSLSAIYWLERALSLSLLIKNKSLTSKVVNQYFESYPRIVEPTLAGTWPYLFDDLYDQKKIDLTSSQRQFIIDSLEHVLKICADPSIEQFNPWSAEDAAIRLATHYRKEGSIDEAHRGTLTAGKAFEKLAEGASAGIALAWLEDVHERYRAEGLYEDSLRILKEIQQKSAVAHHDFKKIEHQIKIDKNEYDRWLESICENGLEIALTKIAVEFCPSIDQAQDSLKKLRTSKKVDGLFSIKKFLDGRESAVIGSINSDPEGRLMGEIGQIIDSGTPFLRSALEEISIRYQPDPEDFVAFLSHSPVFTADRFKILQAGFEAYLKDNYVAAIHILAPQIEHHLRLMLRYFGQPSIRPSKGKYAGQFQEKNINEILEGEAVIKKRMAEEARLYLLSYLADRRGQHVRHRVAHALMLQENFGWVIADRLVHCLLLLGILVDGHEDEEEPDSQNETARFRTEVPNIGARGL